MVMIVRMLMIMMLMVLTMMIDKACDMKLIQPKLKGNLANMQMARMVVTMMTMMDKNDRRDYDDVDHFDDAPALPAVPPSGFKHKHFRKVVWKRSRRILSCKRCKPRQGLLARFLSWASQPSKFFL